MYLMATHAKPIDKYLCDEYNINRQLSMGGELIEFRRKENRHHF